MVEPLHLDDDVVVRASLAGPLQEHGINAFVISREDDLEMLGSHGEPDLVQLVLFDLTRLPQQDLERCVQRCSELRVPVIALVSGERVADLDVTTGIDDFIVSPPSPDELVARAAYVLQRRKSPTDDDVIRVGGLTINPATHEVSVRGKRVGLRFKEYELLRLLATNPGRVYSREVLLSQIWGYDYFGGTRTVDVHIRRLRSKIEDTDHSFVETVWNVGYRLRDPSLPP